MALALLPITTLRNPDVLLSPMETPHVLLLALFPITTAQLTLVAVVFELLPIIVLKDPSNIQDPAFVPKLVLRHPVVKVLKAQDPTAKLFLDEMSLKLIVAPDVIEDTGLFKQTLVPPLRPITLKTPSKESSLLEETYTQLPINNPCPDGKVIKTVEELGRVIEIFVKQDEFAKVDSLLKAPAPTAIEHLGFTTDECKTAHGRGVHTLPNTPVLKQPTGAVKPLVKVNVGALVDEM